VNASGLLPAVPTVHIPRPVERPARPASKRARQAEAFDSHRPICPAFSLDWARQKEKQGVF